MLITLVSKRLRLPICYRFKKLKRFSHQLNSKERLFPAVFCSGWRGRTWIENLNLGQLFQVLMLGLRKSHPKLLWLVLPDDEVYLISFS